MTESSTSLGFSESENIALKEALLSQQQLLQKLYNELDEEREASSTAASETLSMILRLQGEKAAVKMEANQYKRLAEEKMHHAEEVLVTFEDLMYQKEMEIASLEYQVQLYRHKLIGLVGYSDASVGENKLLERNGDIRGDSDRQTNVRRNSMPPIALTFSYQKKGTKEKERSISPSLFPKLVVESKTYSARLEDSSAGEIHSYSEQIRDLDKRVREIVRSPSLDPSVGAVTAKWAQIEHPESIICNEGTAEPSCSSSVYDVFEVPQAHVSEKVFGVKRKQQSDFILKGNGGLGKQDSAPKEHSEDRRHNESHLSRPVDGIVVDCHRALCHSTIGVAESCSKFQKGNQASEIVEVERHVAIQERGVEELTMLKGIQEQLNSIESEIRSWKTKKSSSSSEVSLLSLSEAMLHFWL